jgi:hypothetical protein
MSPDLQSSAPNLSPEIPSSLAAAYPASAIGMRRFGVQESDLAIDFSGNNDTQLITRLLEQCAVFPEGRPSPGFFRDLSVGRRLECLLALAVNEVHSAFEFSFHCAGCKQEIELEITLEEIAGQQREADRIETVEVELEGKTFRFRKPCGRDQENWGRMAFSNPAEAAGAIAESLALSEDLPAGLGPGAIDLIDEAMDAADPLVNFLCRANCAECNFTNEFPIDLGAVALDMLRRFQQRLIVMVHKLASHYHWSEKEIFAVPHWRRKAFLDLIAAGR